MDARIDPYAVFGLRPGDAHVIRNAGGLVSPYTLRSLVLSQRALGTREVLVAQHTDCGVHGLDDERLAAEITAEVGFPPTWRGGGFADLEESVRASIRRLRAAPGAPPPRPRSAGRSSTSSPEACGPSPRRPAKKFGDRSDVRGPPAV